MKDTRDVFLQRLEKDLIGPFDGLTEALFSKPSDHYLTGILYPKETRIPDSEQEDDDEVFGGKQTSQCGSGGHKVGHSVLLCVRTFIMAGFGVQGKGS